MTGLTPAMCVWRVPSIIWKALRTNPRFVGKEDIFTQDSFNSCLCFPHPVLPHRSQTYKPHSRVNQFLKLDQSFHVCLPVSESLVCVSLHTHNSIGWLSLGNLDKYYIHLKQAQRCVGVRCPCGNGCVHLLVCICLCVHVFTYMFTLGV